MASEKPRSSARSRAKASDTATAAGGGWDGALPKLIAGAERCADEAQIHTACAAFCEAIGHEGWLLACSLPHLRISDERIPHVSFSGYDSRWIAHYNAHRYFEHDPVVKRGLTAHRPFDWSELSDLAPAAATLFAEAASFGIRGGFSVPLRGPLGARGLLNFSRSRPQPLPADERVAVEAAALYFGVLLMEAVVRVGDQVAADLAGVAAEFKDDARAVLAGMAAGWSDAELAMRLDLTPRAVGQIADRILRKLRCSSREQALARAAFLDLLPGAA